MTEPLDADYVVDRYGRAWYALGNGSEYWTSTLGGTFEWCRLEATLGPLGPRNYEYAYDGR